MDSRTEDIKAVKDSLDSKEKLAKKEAQPEKEDVSKSQKVSTETKFNYRIRDDYSHNVIGSYGTTILLIDKNNYGRIASIFWENVVKVLDENFLLNRKKDTSLKFYLESDFSLGNSTQTFRIYFDIDTETKAFKITGWSYNQNVSTSSSLKELDIRISKFLSSYLNL